MIGTPGAAAAALLVFLSASAQAQTAPAPVAPPAAPPVVAPAPVLPAEPAPAAPAEPAPAAPGAAAPVAPYAPALGVAEPTVAAPSEEDRATRQVLQAHAGRARSSRRVGGVAMLLSGAGLVGGGLLADLEYDQTYGQVLWIGGAAVGAAGLLSLLKSSPIESLADESGTMSAGSIRANWASMASAARSTRKVSGVVSMALGGAAVVAGSLFAGGVGNLDREDQRDWTVAFFVLSGSLIGGGLSSLLVESELETGYRSAYGTEASKPFALSFGASPTRGGAAAGVSAVW